MSFTPLSIFLIAMMVLFLAVWAFGLTHMTKSKTKEQRNGSFKLAVSGLLMCAVYLAFLQYEQQQVEASAAINLVEPTT